MCPYSIHSVLYGGVTMTYKIIRMYRDSNKRPRVIKRGLSLSEARAHCKRPDTMTDSYFDGFEAERGAK